MFEYLVYIIFNHYRAVILYLKNSRKTTLPKATVRSLLIPNISLTDDFANKNFNKISIGHKYRHTLSR